MLEKIKGMPNVSWCGDDRFDSMGHRANYGAYSMLCCNISKIVHFEILQVSHLIYSNTEM